MPLLDASARSDVHICLAVLVAGALIGAAGHLTRVRWLIVLGIAAVGAAVVLFAFVLRPGAG